MLIIYTPKTTATFIQNEVGWLRRNQIDLLVVTRSEPEWLERGFLVLNERFSKVEKLSTFLRSPLFTLRLLWNDIKRANRSERKASVFLTRLDVLLIAQLRSKELKRRGLYDDRNKHFSYFMGEDALMLSVAIRKKWITSYFGRAHGRDVDERREPITGRLPFQWFKYETIDSVHCASRSTCTYLQEKYPEFSKKFKTQYLGTHVPSSVPAISNSDRYSVVSVGTVRNVKRFHLVAELLAVSERKIDWVHFGGVNERDPLTPRFKSAIEALMKRGNVRVKLYGHTKNQDLIKHYEQNHIDLFIMFSEFEGGVPVSIQEAQSFGIPVLSTNVGGVSELVNHTSGVLIQKDWNIKEALDGMYRAFDSLSRNAQTRQQIRANWNRSFSLESNCEGFYKELGII